MRTVGLRGRFVTRKSPTSSIAHKVASDSETANAGLTIFVRLSSGRTQVYGARELSEWESDEGWVRSGQHASPSNI